MNHVIIPVRQMDDIRDFHEKFGLAYDGPVRNLVGELRDFRIKFLREETAELEDAFRMGDLEKALDAMVDLDYVLKGTIYLAGMSRIYPEAWRRVHRANMQKVQMPSDNPNERGKALGWDVVKPPGWVSPRLWDLVTGGE